MNVTFDGQELFASGPARVEDRGASLRHAQQEPVGQLGARVVGQGRAARQLVQTGTLLADSPEELREQVTAIEAYLDGLPHELVDEHGRAWANVVMLAVEPRGLVGVGTRWKLEYRVNYVQVEEG